MKGNDHCIALLAHVDAGKTTLSESILFNTGTIRKLGRVDHKTSFLDTVNEERERGITIFSKQALFYIGEKRFSLMDTPGHTDFSAEMERVLSILDFAVLIISAQDGISGHDLTLWRLLEAYKVPAVIFVNKCDRPGLDRDKLLRDMNKSFGAGCVDFSILSSELSQASPYAAENAEVASIYEQIAALDEITTERFLEDQMPDADDIKRLFAERKLFPCLFGSALKNTGVDTLLQLIDHLSDEREYPDTFAAKVFKVTRDASGARLTHVRITGGSIRPRDSVTVNSKSKAGNLAYVMEGIQESSQDIDDASTDLQKINRIQLYSGSKFEQLEYACAGMTVTLSGIEDAEAGDTLGNEPVGKEQLLAPLFSVGVCSEDVPDAHKLYFMLKEIEAEIPELDIGFDETHNEVNMRLMGEVQNEVISSIVERRFGIKLSFTESTIVYKETISAPVICAGHFEPLRHYAEVHLLIEPAERGSGIEFSDKTSRDVLSGNYRRLIMSQLAAKRHIGVLTGSELTDVRISLINGRAHEKHTEGGDFRQAAWRAVRQGLMKSRAKGSCVLLEPYYEFELRVPEKNVGRAMNDLSRLAGSFAGPVLKDENAVFTGRAAVSAMRSYAAEVTAYTAGFGSLSLNFCGYDECNDAAAVIEQAGYEPELDLKNQSGSVFCTHGAGYYVPWNEVDGYLHIDIRSEETEYWNRVNGNEIKAVSGRNDLSENNHDADSNYDVSGRNHDDAANLQGKSRKVSKAETDYLGAGLKADKELEEIFNRNLGGNKGRNPDKAVERRNTGNGYAVKKTVRGEMNSEAADAGSTGNASENSINQDGSIHSKHNEYNNTLQSSDAESTKDKYSKAAAGRNGRNAAAFTAKKHYLIVDGYNIIFAWPELKELAAVNIDSARTALSDILANYQGFKGMTLILVFDAYKVKGGLGSVEKYHNIYIVYTKEAQTADAYIEKTVHEIGHKEYVTVASSDGLEQTIVFGEGAVRMSARELHAEVEAVKIDIRRDFLEKRTRLDNNMNLPGM